MNAAAERALDMARDSLADARLLFERDRRTAPVLLDLALRQTLAAIGISLGLDTTDSLPLDVLLQRVPSDHPASALVGRLADPRARDADTVEQLIDALASPAPARPSTPRPAPTTARRRPAGAAPALSEPARTAVVAGGPTAFEAAAERRRSEGGGQAAKQEEARDASSTAFWALMDRWPVSDLDALALLGGERDLTKKGARPRFRLHGAEAARFARLRRIDTALEVLGETPAWLSRAQKTAPFGGQTPLALLIDDPDAAAERILHVLNRAGLDTATRRKAP